MYTHFDPINAAIELARRGLYRYTKDLTGYPQITRGIIDTVESLLTKEGKDVQCLSDSKLTWVTLYNLSRECRWRGGFDEETMSKFSMKNKMSRVSLIR